MTKVWAVVGGTEVGGVYAACPYCSCPIDGAWGRVSLWRPWRVLPSEDGRHMVHEVWPPDAPTYVTPHVAGCGYHPPYCEGEVTA